MDIVDSLDSVNSSSSLLLQDQPTSPAAVKFGLFVKTHEIKQLEESLKQVLLMPKQDQMAWLEEHETFVGNLLDSFVTDSTLALDGLQLDNEALQLSIEFVTVLRDVMNTIRSLFNDRTNLMS
jgi:hypothetical protein